jgi:phenylacetate-CoA ligase
MLKYKGTKIYPKAIENAIASIDGVCNYIIEAFTGDDLSDKIVVKVGCKNQKESFKRKLYSHIEACARVTPIIKLVSAQKVLALQSDMGRNRKLKTFVDRRCPQKLWNKRV